MRTVLAIMARYPEPGRVKTRLGAVIGRDAACTLYTAFLRDLAGRFADGPRPVVWFVHPPGRNLEAILGRAVSCRPQRGADLATRMGEAFADLFGAGFARVLLIGADVPHVADAWLDEAEQALAHCDVVFGPASDGGYYLVALRVAHDVFSGVPMGTPTTLGATLVRCRDAGLRVHLLPETFDVDGAEDVGRLRAVLRTPGCPALPETAAVLARPGWGGGRA